MNDKSAVSKELNAKHRKILEGLLKLPENKECADCKCKGPRWASVSLGIFVCMQCSGIHRSLGVHISKVRSTTLDTWLPEQVAFIQTMGNEKANIYWEAELPPNYDRVGIENFIRAKYEEKRWVPKDGKLMPPPTRFEEKAEVQRQTPMDRTGHGNVSSSGNLFDSRKAVSAISTRGNGSIKITLPMPPKGPEQVRPAPVKEQMIQKKEPIIPADSSKEAAGMVSPPKVDSATDLFDMLTIDDSSGNTNGGESGDDDTWAGFQVASASSSTEKNQIIAPAKLDENQTSSTSGIEDLFKDSTTDASSLEEKNQTTTTPAKLVENKILSASGTEHLFKDEASSTPISMSEKSKKDLKDDIMSLFEKSNIVSPFAVHQQQLAMLAQQQSLLMAAASTASGSTPAVPGNTQLGLNDINLRNQGWANVGLQFPGMMLPATRKVDLEKYMQVQMGHAGTMHPLESSFHMSSSTSDVGIHNGSSIHGSVPSASNKQLPSSHSSGNEYDFSSLTQGLFSKR